MTGFLKSLYPILLLMNTIFRQNVRYGALTRKASYHALQLTNQALDKVGDNALYLLLKLLFTGNISNAGFRPVNETLLQSDAEAEKALGMDPKLSLVHFVKGAIAYTLGDLQKAIQHYKQAAELEAGGESLAWNSLTHALSGKIPEARKYGDHATMIDPLNILALCFRGLIEIYGGDFQCAILWLQRGLEVMPGDPMTLGFCAISQIYAGNREESLVLFNQLECADGSLLNSFGAMWRAALCKDEAGFRKFSARFERVGQRRQRNVLVYSRLLCNNGPN